MTVAEDGRAAIEEALAAERAGRPYGLVLMDMQMPEMDGYEATAALRCSGYQGAIVALTARAMPEDRQRSLESGCDELLTKPLHRADLLTLAHRYLDGAPLTPS